ncbi:type VI secretion system tip protein VgrG [Paraburkholderia sp. T12-10]|nr:type VI secretion system tip protein VgrG [Paraburkholderia sp. T12-10]
MTTGLSAEDLQTIASGRQKNRLLTLSFPEGNAPYRTLVVNRLEAEESLSRDFRYVLEILSDNARLDPKDFTGKRLAVQLLREDGSFRYFNGYVFSFRLVKTDGDIAFYEAELGPWLRYLTLSKRNRLFSQLSIRGQIAAVFDNHGTLPVWEWKVRQRDTPMTMACQFDEHDHNYVHRRLEHLGLCYWYEHTAHAHTLIVSDPLRDEPQIDGGTYQMPYQREAGSKEADGIASFSPAQQVTSTHTAISRADFKDPEANAHTWGLVKGRIAGFQGSGMHPLEWHEYAGSYGYRNTEDGQELNTRRIEAIEASARWYEAKGNSRLVMPGRWFRLTDSFGYAISRNPYDDEYLIVSAHHVATNNYLQGVDVPAVYHNSFTCVPKRTRWRPMPGYNSVDTRILAPQTATVVGVKGESLYTDQYGRVLAQFNWDREGRCTTWVRVSSGWAGGSQGMTALPRIGSEVIVMWVDGNPDHPIIVGCVHNALKLSSWQLPHQRALTGIRTRELIRDAGNRAGGRSNHLVLDDTENAIQVQLRSDHGASQLSLGSITRIEDWEGRKDARGEGFELRTDAVGAIRSGQGLLVSTEVRPQGRSHLADVSEPVSRLNQAQTLHGQLARLSQHHQGQERGNDQTQVAEVLQSQADGIEGSGGGHGSFPELSEPHLLLAGAAGLEMTTPATAHLASGQHVAVTAGQTVSLAAGKSLLASVSEKFSLFVHRMGMKLIAASGKVQVQAQNDDLELLAKKVVAIISTTDWITLTAKQGIRLNAGNSELVIDANGINGKTPGTNVIHAAAHQTVGPQNVPTVFPNVPDTFCERCFEIAAGSGNALVPH